MDMVNEVFNWVVANGYADLNEWAADSNYYPAEYGTWCDDEGNIVDIWECAYGAMELSKERN